MFILRLHKMCRVSSRPISYFVSEFICLSYGGILQRSKKDSETTLKKVCYFFDKQDFRPLSHTSDSHAQNTTSQVRCNWIIGYSVNTNGFPITISRFDRRDENILISTYHSWEKRIPLFHLDMHRNTSRGRYQEI